jgi:hypothetical protein
MSVYFVLHWPLAARPVAAAQSGYSAFGIVQQTLAMV